MRLALFLIGAALAAQSPKPLDTDTFFEMESVASPAISPDGTLIAFSRSWVDKIKDQQRSNIWLVDRDGARLRQLTNGNWRDSAPVWSPDSKRIAFLSDRDGTTQLYTMWMDTREVAQLTHLERAPSNAKWSPDGKTLAYTQRVPDEDPILPIKLPKKPEGAQWAKPVIVIDRLSWRADGVGPTERGYTHVFTVDAAAGGTPRQVTNGKYNHESFEWSPDGKSLLVAGLRKPDAEYLRRDSEIYSVNLASGEIRALTDRKGPDRDAQPSPNGRLVAYTGYDDQKLTFTNSHIYVMDSAGGAKKAWATGLPSSPGDLTWSPDSMGVYYSMQERGLSNLYYLPVGGKPRQVTDGVHVLSSFSMAANGQTAAIRTSFQEPPALVTFDVKRPGASMKKIVDVNADVLEGRKQGDAEELNFTSKDGVKVQGWLIKPANFEPGKKYPMVLWIHGGPWSMYSVAFNWRFQNFAADGYAVLYINPRGSTGYGQEFINGIQYSYPGKDFDDLMAGVDAALAKGYIDERNLFVCGHSGGGVLTAWTVGHTNRFRAAASMAPVINWHSFVGTTDGPTWYDQFQKRPWEDPMEYAVRSPLHYVANVTTPTMVMTGEADLRTPISQSEEFYRALKLLKKPTLLVRAPDEFHGWRRPTHALAYQLYLKAWFEKHRLKDTAASGGN
ncbi:MAG: S9 family peptidase [Bryobacteraceae bacterium]|nr:S9 family peptidase [Bryobacteraceae bacterium]